MKDAPLSNPVGMNNPVGWNFDNSYANLPDAFFVRVKPTPVRSPSIALLNYKLGEELGLDLRALTDKDAASIFCGNALPIGADPIAQAYAGHQFGGFTMLGDGRAILLGEQITPKKARIDIQLKGPGPTPFSRRGDGRAALGPMLREYIISEALANLGIPTTRSLAVVKTGEPVYRESVLPGAILTRTAASHIRVGTFEYISARNDRENLKKLADYTIERHYSELVSHDSKYVAFFEAVMQRQSRLVAQWQMIGFIHGVMNTDNVAISGESIDFGPCAFMNTYDPATVFSSIDTQGRYAYGNQPTICHWNLVRFAEALLPLFDSEEENAIAIANGLIGKFPDQFRNDWTELMRLKLGFSTSEDGDEQLAVDFLDWMYDEKLDFVNTFRALSMRNFTTDSIFQSSSFQSWNERWGQRLARENTSRGEASERMRKVNPSVIPRNEFVEEALMAATREDNMRLVENLLAVLSEPYKDYPSDSKFVQSPPPGTCGYRTFCGT